MGSPVSTKLCITSYNSTGFGLSSQNHIRTLLLFSDICCIQEHFLLDCNDKKSSNTDKLKNHFSSSHDMHVVPAVKHNNYVSRGRGSGCLATIWKKELTKFVSRVKCDNPRLLGTRFNFPKWNILMINCYFPCDPRSENYDDTTLVNLIADIRSLIIT